MRNSARRLLSAYRASRSGPEGGVAVQDGCTPPTAGLHGGSGRGLARQRPVQALSPGQYSDTAQRAQRIRCASPFCIHRHRTQSVAVFAADDPHPFRAYCRRRRGIEPPARTVPVADLCIGHGGRVYRAGNCGRADRLQPWPVVANPWVVGVFALLLCVFAFSLFGCFELTLPQRWLSRVSALQQRLSGGKIMAVFGMGMLSALAVGACMSAPLFGILAFIAQT